MSAADASAASGEVEAVVRRWERAIETGAPDGILAQQTEDVVMADVPAPPQSPRVRSPPSRSGAVFPRWPARREFFVIDGSRATAGEDVAFATGLLRIGGLPSPHVGRRIRPARGRPVDRARTSFRISPLEDPETAR